MLHKTGSPAPVAPAAEAACSLLHHAIATNLLSWACTPEALESLGLGPLLEGCPGGLPELIWRASVRTLGAPTVVGSALDLAGLPVPAEFRLAPGARRSMEVPLASPPLSPRHRQGPDGGDVPSDGRPAWQAGLEGAAAAVRAGAPRPLRLLWALHMVAAAGAVLAEVAAAKAEQEPGEGQGAPADNESARQAGALVLQLVMPAGQLLQAQVQRHAGGDRQGQQDGGGGGLDELSEGLAAVFCRAVAVSTQGRALRQYPALGGRISFLVVHWLLDGALIRSHRAGACQHLRSSLERLGLRQALHPL